MAQPQIVTYDEKKGQTPPEFDEDLYKRLKSWFSNQNAYLKGSALTIIVVLLVSPFFIHNQQNTQNQAAEPTPTVVLPPTDTPTPSVSPTLSPHTYGHSF